MKPGDLIKVKIGQHGYNYVARFIAKESVERIILGFAHEPFNPDVCLETIFEWQTEPMSDEEAMLWKLENA